MSSGILRVQSFAARQSAPVPSVSVTVTGPDGESYHLTTDSEGNAPDLTLWAPSEAYSLDPNNTTVQPYSTWDILAEKSGWRPVELRGVQVFACQTTLASIELIPAEEGLEGQAEPELVEIPPHSLFANADAHSGPKPVEGCPARVLEQPIIPTNITVHLGRPAASARNVTVSFRRYIANVASSEVYPTWVGRTIPTKFLRAKCGGWRPTARCFAGSANSLFSYFTAAKPAPVKNSRRSQSAASRRPRQGEKPRSGQSKGPRAPGQGP